VTSGLPFTPDALPVRLAHNINGAIKTRITHGDFVHLAAGWAFDSFVFAHTHALCALRVQPKLR